MSTARRKKPSPHENEVFEVTVWSWDGDVLKRLWGATYDEAVAVQEEYGDDPLATVVIEQR